MERLYALAEEGRQSICPSSAIRINIGRATCSIAKGADSLSNKLKSRDNWPVPVKIVEVGCLGACFAEPLVHLRLPGGSHYFFGKVDSKSLWHMIRITEGHEPSSFWWMTAQERNPGYFRGFEDLEVMEIRNPTLQRFLKPQLRQISNCWGFIDPDNIAEYIATGGYLNLAKTLTNSRAQAIPELLTKIESLGLDKKILLLDANNEKITAGHPRHLSRLELACLENNPHRLLEGLILVSYALGVSQAVITVPKEYSLAENRLERAIITARHYGFLGNNIFNTGYSLEVTLTNEESSILPDQPPLLHPLAALSAIPEPINGEETHSGTSLFYFNGDLTGHGFVEVHSGTKMNTLVASLDRKAPDAVKGLQLNYPWGDILPYCEEYMGRPQAEPVPPVSFAEVMVLNKHRCIVDHVLNSIKLIAKGLCEQEPFCRAKVSALEEKLLLLTTGRGQQDLPEEIETLAKAIKKTAKCQLGCSVAGLLLTSLEYFQSEYAAHPTGHCPGLTCKELIRFEIIQSLCKDCRCCYLVCPTEAVKHRIGDKRFFVDDSLCIKCGACAATCPCGCIKPVSEPGQKSS